jgi:hypothetical protein
MVSQKVLFASVLLVSGCASISENAVDRQGEVVVHVTSRSTFVIGGRRYPKEAAQYWLNRLRLEHHASSLKFLVNSTLLSRKVKRGDWTFDTFKDCSEAEVGAFLLAHDAYFGSPKAIFEFDPRTEAIGKETPCSGRTFTMEM